MEEEVKGQAGNPEDVMQEAVAGLQQAAKADAEAAEVLADMGQEEVAQLLAESARLKMMAIEKLTGNEGEVEDDMKDEETMQSEMTGVSSPDAAGRPASQTDMRMR